MDIKFTKSKTEPLFQAYIYKSSELALLIPPLVSPTDVKVPEKTLRARTIYRVVIGRMGTEEPEDKNFIDYHEISDFMPRKEIEKWVDEQVTALEKAGEKVICEENLSYLLNKAVDELSEESKISNKDDNK